MKAHLTRRYMFSASHRLHSEEMSDDENNRGLRQMQQPARPRSQLHGRGNSERRSRPEHGDGVQSG